MPGDRVSVLVLYGHAILGQGLERLLAAEHGLDVRAADLANEAAVEEALRLGSDVIVFEDGARVDPLDVFRRTDCSLLIVVSIGSSDAWTIRRDTIRTAPDRLFEVILGACLGRAGSLALETGGPDGEARDPSEIPLPATPAVTDPVRGRLPRLPRVLPVGN